MSTTTEIRNILKTMGFNNRQVSVAGCYTNITITIKTIAAYNQKAAIEQVAKQFEHIRYCQASGEILAGGNTFVSVIVAQDVRKEISLINEVSAKELLTKVLAECEVGTGYHHPEKDAFLIKSHDGMVSVWIRKEGDNHATQISQWVSSNEWTTVSTAIYDAANRNSDVI